MIIRGRHARTRYGKIGRSSSASAAAAWLPSDLTNLVVWYRAGDETFNAGTTPAADGQTVYKWGDAKNSYDVLSSATESLKPIFRSSVNGKPAVEFDGTNDYLQYLGSAVQTIDSQIWIVLSQAGSMIDGKFVVDRGDGNDGAVIRASGTSGQFSSFSGLSGPVSDATNGLITANSIGQLSHWWKSGGTNSEISVNAETPVTGNPGEVNGTGITFGARGGSKLLNWTGFIHEIFVISSKASAGEKTNILTYFSSRYGL